VNRPGEVDAFFAASSYFDLKKLRVVLRVCAGEAREDGLEPRGSAKSW